MYYTWGNIKEWLLRGWGTGLCFQLVQRMMYPLPGICAEEVGVAVVPGSSFYRDQNPDGRSLIRFCFCKQMVTLEAAAERLAKIK